MNFPFNIEIKQQDVATLANLLFGSMALVFLGASNTSAAAVLVLVSVIADGADGYLARARGQGSLGFQLDSLADFVSFGLVPSLLAFYLLRDALGIPLAFFFLSFIYVASGMIRLARYNTTPQTRLFTGLPITAAGLIVSLYVIAGFPPVGLVPLLLLLSGLMLSDFEYSKVSNNLTLAVLGILLLSVILLNLIGNDLSQLISIVVLIFSAIYVLNPLYRR
ncbi:MAG: CDP-alcohol phosphatidyltransferase family protein [Halobacteriota archaeon]